jgi:RNA polymerase sigma-70 factor (ECF subfamily)
VVSIVASGSLDELDIVEPEVSAEERLEFQDEIREVAKVLAQLPESYRETLILRRVGGLSQKQTAQRLGVTEKTVENHSARGLMMLLKLIGREGTSRVRSSSNQVDQATLEDESGKRRD